MHGTMKNQAPITVRDIKKAVRTAAKASGTGATGYTVLKRRSAPVVHLVETGKIGPEELQAAVDLNTAFFALSGGLMFRPQITERQDRSHQSDHWSERVSQCVKDYHAFAEHWSKRAKWGDRTFEVLISAIVDERPFVVIETDLGLRHGRAVKTVIGGLRDYAARAGIVTGKQAESWTVAAMRLFKAQHPDLRMAIIAAAHS